MSQNLKGETFPSLISYSIDHSSQHTCRPAADMIDTSILSKPSSLVPISGLITGPGGGSWGNNVFPRCAASPSYRSMISLAAKLV